MLISSSPQKPARFCTIPVQIRRSALVPGSAPGPSGDEMYGICMVGKALEGGRFGGHQEGERTANYAVQQ